MAPIKKKLKTIDTLDKDTFFLIFQFLGENNCIDSLHTLEKESGVFFGMMHFQDLVTNGDLDEAEKYLSGFTSIGDNNFSTQTFFSIRRQKYYEALDRNDFVKADEILQKDLKVFANYNEDVYRDFALLLPHFREKKLVTKYEDTKSAREQVLRELKQLIERNPVLRDKLHFPVFQSSRLRTLVHQGLKGEPQIFNNPKPDLQTKNLFVDHNLGGEPYSTNVGDFLPIGAHESGDGQTQRDVNLDIQRNVWKPTEISRPLELCSLRLPDSTLASRIIKLMYTTAGNALLALSYNAVHKLWKWEPDQPNGKASAKVKPLLSSSPSGILMTNETSGINPEEASPCFALSKNNYYVISASGGMISLYNISKFKTMKTFKTPPPAATSIAFHPRDNNLIAIGMDDSTIQIYDVIDDKLISKLEGHNNKVTGLAFSSILDILVSSDANSKLCIWDISGWGLRTSTIFPMPPGRVSKFHTRVQFHKDQSTVLAVHEASVAVYEASEMKFTRQWVRPAGSILTDATYSSDGESIFVSLKNGRVLVLISNTLRVRCSINPPAYMPSEPSTVYPVVIAAHPSEANQIAVGLSNGGVYVLEPCSPNNKWGNLPCDTGKHAIDATNDSVQNKQ